jgi:hypothetical protein
MTRHDSAPAVEPAIGGSEGWRITMIGQERLLNPRRGKARTLSEIGTMDT